MCEAMKTHLRAITKTVEKIPSQFQEHTSHKWKIVVECLADLHTRQALGSNLSPKTRYPFS